uniref:Uncharacterized protein n=1 Tax=Picea sitchensis TaxID=3332 RepID=A9NT01_PICSI|nr:unknown [Picea sitchensis]
MGNAIPSRGHKRIKIMKLDGQEIKFKAPMTVDEIMKKYPNHSVLDSEAVRHLGIRAKPLHESTQLEPKRLYFLVEWPKTKIINNIYRAPTRVRSEISTSAKSRLESMLLARRSVSDISAIGASNGNRAGSLQYPSLTNSPSAQLDQTGGEDGAVRLKIRLTKAQLSKFMSESQTGSETAEKILDAYLTNAESKPEEAEEEEGEVVPHSGSLPWKPALRSVQETNCKLQTARRNRVRFSSAQENGEVF